MKRALAIAMTAVLAFSLVGCSSSSDSTNDDADDAAEEVVEEAGQDDEVVSELEEDSEALEVGSEIIENVETDTDLDEDTIEDIVETETELMSEMWSEMAELGEEAMSEDMATESVSEDVEYEEGVMTEALDIIEAEMTESELSDTEILEIVEEESETIAEGDALLEAITGTEPETIGEEEEEETLPEEEDTESVSEDVDYEEGVMTEALDIIEAEVTESELPDTEVLGLIEDESETIAEGDALLEAITGTEPDTEEFEGDEEDTESVSEDVDYEEGVMTEALDIIEAEVTESELPDTEVLGLIEDESETIAEGDALLEAITGTEPDTEEFEGDEEDTESVSEDVDYEEGVMTEALDIIEAEVTESELPDTEILGLIEDESETIAEGDALLEAITGTEPDTEEFEGDEEDTEAAEAETLPEEEDTESVSEDVDYEEGVMTEALDIIEAEVTESELPDTEILGLIEDESETIAEGDALLEAITGTEPDTEEFEGDEEDTEPASEEKEGIIGEIEAGAAAAGAAIAGEAENIKEDVEGAVEDVKEMFEGETEMTESLSELLTESDEGPLAAIEKGDTISYADYDKADVDSLVTVKSYVQAAQAYKEDGTASLYLQDEDGGIFVYAATMSEDDYNALLPGTEVIVSGYKSEWSGEVEIVDAQIEIVDGGDTYVAVPKDVTTELTDDTAVDFINQFVGFFNMTIEASTDPDGNDVAFLYAWDGSGQEGDDLYFDASIGGDTFTFVVESDLCDSSTDVYKTVESLQVGDVVDMFGFLYMYEGYNPHITEVDLDNGESSTEEVISEEVDIEEVETETEG